MVRHRLQPITDSRTEGAQEVYAAQPSQGTLYGGAFGMAFRDGISFVGYWYQLAARTLTSPLLIDGLMSRPSSNTPAAVSYRTGGSR
jgi:hypothetical protein